MSRIVERLVRSKRSQQMEMGLVQERRCGLMVHTSRVQQWVLSSILPRQLEMGCIGRIVEWALTSSSIELMEWVRVQQCIAGWMVRSSRDQLVVVRRFLPRRLE
jgi:hypothetical protein